MCMHATSRRMLAACACGCNVLYVRTVPYRTCRRPFIHHHQNNVGRCSRFGKSVLFVGERERDSGNRGLPESDYPLAPRPTLLFVPRLPSPRSASSRAILPSPFCLSPPPPLFLPLLFCLGHGRDKVAVAVVLYLLIKINSHIKRTHPNNLLPSIRLSVSPLVHTCGATLPLFLKSSQLNGHVHIQRESKNSRHPLRTKRQRSICTHTCV